MKSTDVTVSITNMDIFKDLFGVIVKILKDERCPDDLKEDINAVIQKYKIKRQESNNERS